MNRDGNPYVYRWHIINNPIVSVYFHIQVSDDGERMHDHPGDNTSIILAGGYREYTCNRVGDRYVPVHPIDREPEEVIHRLAETPHRLTLLGKYSMSLFVMGPKRRDWGFWMDDDFLVLSYLQLCFLRQTLVVIQ